MSRSGEVTVTWAGEERLFRLALGQWRKIQEKCDVGPEELLGRLARSVMVRAKGQGIAPSAALTLAPPAPWRVDDVREPILQGLLGTGLELNAAHRLVAEWVDDRPLFEALPLALAIVLGALTAPEDEKPPGEPQGGSPTNLSPAASSGSPDTTRPAAPSDSPPARSTTSPFGNSAAPSGASTGPTAPRKSPRRPALTTSPPR